MLFWFQRRLASSLARLLRNLGGGAIGGDNTRAQRVLARMRNNDGEEDHERYDNEEGCRLRNRDTMKMGRMRILRSRMVNAMMRRDMNNYMM